MRCKLKPGKEALSFEPISLFVLFSVNVTGCVINRKGDELGYGEKNLWVGFLFIQR